MTVKTYRKPSQKAYDKAVIALAISSLPSHRPLAIDLFTGLHGWTNGLVAEGFDVVGFDIVDMSAEVGVVKPDHFELVIQDVCTLHGAQFKDVALIVASPPCQEYSYMAMPWSLAKAKAAAIRADETGEALAKLNRLFNECFRIQREASFAAGRHIPMVVENVRGAQPWVGRARANFGSFFLWGDVPALMPITLGREVMKAGVTHRSDGTTSFHGHTKNDGGSWFNQAHNTTSGKGKNPVHKLTAEGVNQGGDWFNASEPSMSRLYGSKSPQRKMASAMIAMIPLPLSRHIGATFRP